MQWLFTHPYTVAIAVAAVLLATGSLIVSNRAPARSGSEDLRAWSGVGTNLLSSLPYTPAREESERGSNLYSEVVSGPPFHYSATPPPILPSGAQEELGLEELLAMLSRPAQSATPAEGSELDVYSFIPSGLVSISSHTKERTEAQQKLFDYGNEVGSTIETYEDTYRNAPRILKDQFEDREDPAKNDALRQLAEGLARVGESLTSMEEVPEGVSSAHVRLAASYEEMGTKLARIPDARSEQEVLDAMLTYNASVEAFTKNFIALALLFSAHGVSFSQDDPGRIFTFTASSF